MEARSWALLAAGAVGGTAGTLAWMRLRGRRGAVLRIGTEYFVQASVAEELASRAISATTEGAERARVIVNLGPRGTLVLTRTDLDARSYGPLYHLSFKGTEEDSTETVVRDLVSWGLALPGEEFTSIDEVRKGAGRPLGINFRAPEKSALSSGPRPAGHFFRVGDTFFGDTRLLETLEWVPGAEPNENGTFVIIPLWKRGALYFKRHTEARLLPEQLGSLWRLDMGMSTVRLDDLLTELMQLGLVGWGGEWRQFPSRVSEYPPTGTPPWNPSGHVIERNGEIYVDEPVLKFARTRMEGRLTHEGPELTWRGARILLRPYNGVLAAVQRGTLYAVGKASDPGVAAFIAEVIFRRLAVREEPISGGTP